MGVLRWIGYGALTLFVLGVVGYYWLFVDSHMPAGSYRVDLSEVRKLSDTIAGDKPIEVRVERVTSFRFPMTAAVAGAGWNEVEVPVYAYQIAYADRTVVIDAGVSGNEAGADPHFDRQAHDRMLAAMRTASAVVVTHEHPDHIGGLVAHPNLSEVLVNTRLTQEQVDHPEKMFGLSFPEGALASYRPLSYDRYHALAPGIVLIKSPGHTPGSQMVFVKTAGGREYLFLGDVAWRFESVERLAARARLVSMFFLGEDRDAVLLQLAELKRLKDSNPELVMVAGHDIDQMSRLLKSGTIVQGFR
jgi:glyoxylase-like metal-dependent hydrolase (beta-lactamase superfamily II)